ncbi:MAG: hypothetical protein ABJ027_21600, partial [Roseibium sp.]
YADLDRPEATISVSLKHLTQDVAKLVIADNGPGFDTASSHSGMGTKIIRGMVMQLDGSHTYTFENGTAFSAEVHLGLVPENCKRCSARTLP